MSVLLNHFDSKVNHCSPVQADCRRVVNYDSDGNEFITYPEVDFKSIQSSHGLVSDWSLEALLKAGVNPNFPIHTGNPTRLEGIDDVNHMAAYADQMLKDIEGGPEDLPELS